VHGDFTRPDDDAPAGQRGQRPSCVGACSVRIFFAEPCSAMNRTRVRGRSGALAASSSAAADDLNRSSAIAASGSPVRDVLGERHPIDPCRESSISTSTAQPPHRLDGLATPVTQSPDMHRFSFIHCESG